MQLFRRSGDLVRRVASAALLMLGAATYVVFFGVSPAGATNGSVHGVVVTVSPEATGYGKATYSVTFVATDGLTQGSPEIAIQAPAGTVFPYEAQTITDNTHPNDNGLACSSRGNASNIEEIGYQSYCGVPIPAGDSVTINIQDVTNPPSGGSDTLTVTTDQDTTAATSAPYRIAPEGYWLVGSDGGIFTFGSAQFYGSTGNLRLNRPVVGITPTGDRGGYWLDASDGGVFSFGDTNFYGSIPGLGISPAASGLPHSLSAPIVGMVPSVDDHGYFMVGSDGGVFAFGDATFKGSCPGIGGCVGHAVSVMPDASGHGYWLVTDVGAVYAFGDAPYLGAPGNTGFPITSAVRTPDGGGYWILDAAGDVHGYGDAANLGNDTNDVNPLGNDAAAIFTDIAGDGYGVVTQDGAVTPFGGVPDDGGMSHTTLNGPIIAASGY